MVIQCLSIDAYGINKDPTIGIIHGKKEFGK